jgi:hypothetical protein
MSGNYHEHHERLDEASGTAHDYGIAAFHVGE